MITLSWIAAVSNKIVDFFKRIWKKKTVYKPVISLTHYNFFLKLLLLHNHRAFFKSKLVNSLNRKYSKKKNCFMVAGFWELHASTEFCVEKCSHIWKETKGMTVRIHIMNSFMDDSCVLFTHYENFIDSFDWFSFCSSFRENWLNISFSRGFW